VRRTARDSPLGEPSVVTHHGHQAIGIESVRRDSIPSGHRLGRQQRVDDRLLRPLVVVLEVRIYVVV
jgi:hypothetical protein